MILTKKQPTHHATQNPREIIRFYEMTRYIQTKTNNHMQTEEMHPTSIYLSWNQQKQNN